MKCWPKSKISKKTREQAALICDIAASSAALNWNWFTNEIAWGLGVSHRGGAAVELVHRARKEMNRLNGWGSDIYANCAEAAQLIREGWCPP